MIGQKELKISQLRAIWGCGDAVGRMRPRHAVVVFSHDRSRAPWCRVADLLSQTRITLAWWRTHSCRGPAVRHRSAAQCGAVLSQMLRAGMLFSAQGKRPNLLYAVKNGGQSFLSTVCTDVAGKARLSSRMPKLTC